MYDVRSGLEAAAFARLEIVMRGGNYPLAGAFGRQREVSRQPREPQRFSQ